MIENALYLVACQTAVAIAADHLHSHHYHAARITRKLEALQAMPGLPSHLVENIASLKADFNLEEKRLSKALKARQGELQYARGLNHVR